MRIGIDLGGTKIEGIVLDGAGRVAAQKRVPTPRDDYAGTVQAIAGLVREFERGGPRMSVGLGIPGTISRATGLVKNANSVWLNGRPLHEDLGAMLRRPIRVANDANCFALSEATDGAAAGAEVVFGVILGTGTGGGVVVRGHGLTGPNGVAGEWGHNPLPWPEADEWPGRSCYCGRSGCIETFLSGPGFSADFRSATGRVLTSEQIVGEAAGGDGQAAAALDQYERRLARALASVINLLDPDVIVLGGGLSKLGRLYDRVPPLWAHWVFSDRVDTRLVPPLHGDASGVRGAAWLWEAGSAATTSS
jgi:fructokinase